MAKLQVGDILIARGWPGHVMMVYKEGSSSGKDCARIIHAQGSGKNFHIDPNQLKVGNGFAYLDERANRYRPPWGKLGQNAIQSKKEELRRIAAHISVSAEYGYYRAMRLCMGSSTFGSSARNRLNKYKKRMRQGFREFRKGYLDKMQWQDKFVTNVTCSEAVILCYQLAFEESDQPFFINLDAAHAMPRTLDDWLKDNWTTL